jgi:hypothetical protein
MAMGRLYCLPAFGLLDGRSWPGKGTLMRTDCGIYVATVLNLYAQMPGTRLRAHRSDRALAEHFFDRQIPIDIVEAALLLGSARRMIRSGPSLAAIRSLHYFLPIVEEILAKPFPAGYMDYLRLKIQSTMETESAVSQDRAP